MAALNVVECNVQMPEDEVKKTCLDLDRAIPVSDSFEGRAGETEFYETDSENSDLDYVHMVNPPVLQFGSRTRPMPPALTVAVEPEPDVVAVPSWGTPKVGTGEVEAPEAPSWSPKVNALAILEDSTKQPASTPPWIPVPAPVQHPMPVLVAPTYNPVPMTQEQLDSFTQDVCNQELTVVAVPSTPEPQLPELPQPLQPQQPQHVWWYRVSFLGGIALRTAPDFDSMRTGWQLNHNEIFAVCQRIQGLDGRVYLLLADGRGWAFDDSALLPHDPSVVSGRWSQMQMAFSALVPVPVLDQSLHAPGVEDKKRTVRRQRGGAKRNKSKREDIKAKVSEEADTDTPADSPAEVDSSNSEFEGSMFKEEDFPQLLSTVKSK